MTDSKLTTDCKETQRYNKNEEKLQERSHKRSQNPNAERGTLTHISLRWDSRPY